MLCVKLANIKSNWQISNPNIKVNKRDPFYYFFSFHQSSNDGNRDKAADDTEDNLSMLSLKKNFSPARKGPAKDLLTI